MDAALGDRAVDVLRRFHAACAAGSLAELRDDFTDAFYRVRALRRERFNF